MEKYSERIENARVVFGSYESPNTIYLVNAEAKNVPAMEALTVLGGRQMPLAPDDGDVSGWNTIGMENMLLIEDADVLQLWAPDEAQRAELMARPLWSLMPNVQDGRALVSTNKVGWGSIYTIMECMRLRDKVYALLD